VPAQESPVKPAWQRWNDYGIGCLLEGGAGAKRGHFRQAEEAFRTMLTLGAKDAVPHARVNLARVYIEEGRLDEAARELDAAGKCDPPAPWWSLAWFTAQVNSETATGKEHLDAVIADLGRILDPANQPRDRGFDFTRDYVVRDRLANRLFKRSQFEEDGSTAQREFLLKAVSEAERVLTSDPEDVEAHDLLRQCYSRLGRGAPAPTDGATDLSALAQTLIDAKLPRGDRLAAAAGLVGGVTALGREPVKPDRPKLPTIRELLARLQPAFHASESDAELASAIAAVLAALHRESHLIYKPDEVARANATRIYREKHPAANYAARDRVIYPTTAGHRETILKKGELVATE
jgi:tetratricopeptide (TPR) repeat protein